MKTNFNCHETPKIDDLFNELGLLFPGQNQGDISELIGAIMQLCNIVKTQEHKINENSDYLSKVMNIVAEGFKAVEKII